MPAASPSAIPLLLTHPNSDDPVGPLGSFVLGADGLYYLPSHPGEPLERVPVVVSVPRVWAAVPLSEGALDDLYQAAVIRQEQRRHEAALRARVPIGAVFQFHCGAFSFVAAVGSHADDGVRLVVQQANNGDRPGTLWPASLAWVLAHGARTEWDQPIWSANTPHNVSARLDAWDAETARYVRHVEGMDAPEGWRLS